MSLRNVLQNLHLVRSEVFRGSHFLTDDRRVPRLVPVCDLHGEERPQDRQDIPDDGWNPKRRTLEAAVGDAKSLIVHPESSTHFGQTPEENAKAGVFPDSLRLSVGIEDAEDLIADIGQALDRSQQ